MEILSPYRLSRRPTIAVLLSLSFLGRTITAQRASPSSTLTAKSAKCAVGISNKRTELSNLSTQSVRGIFVPLNFGIRAKAAQYGAMIDPLASLPLEEDGLDILLTTPKM